MLFRRAKTEDKEILRKIWENTFGDSRQFTDWLFNNRFNPQMCYVCELDGKVVSCLHGHKINVNISGTSVPAISISGVATLPEYRGRGIMRKLFENYHAKMRESGCCFSVLTALNPDIYKSLGYVHITDAFFAEDSSEKSEKVQEIAIEENINPLKKCYEKYAQGYNCNILRGAFFKTKMEEYISENCKCIAQLSGDEITSYVIYEKVGEDAFCAEATGKNPEKILENIGMKFTCKLPKDTSKEKIKGITKEDALGYILNIQSFCDKLSINLKEFPPEGSPCAGKLLQSAVGYKIHAEFLEYGFKETPCFYTDLY